MALLSVANLSYHVGDRPLLEGASLTLNGDDHVALVGRNGTGKSTLLRLIASQLRPDAGHVQLARGATCGYLPQDPQLQPGHTLRQEAATALADLHQLHRQLEQVAADMAQAAESGGDDLAQLMRRYEHLEKKVHSAGGYVVDHEIDATLHGVGLEDNLFDVKVENLSGGQKGRLALAKLLLQGCDLLLLDEPTNHLDIAGREWLEQYLQSFAGAVILISHDRWLLDRAATRIYELEDGRLIDYPGNYAQYRQLRAELRLTQQRAWEKQQDLIRREQSFIDRYRAGQRAKQAQGREKRLERLVRDHGLDRPVEADDVSIRIPTPRRSGDVVVLAEHLSKGYGGRALFADLDLKLERGQRLGVIGPNGCGKTTLLRCLLGELAPDAGSVRLGSGVDVGYFRQAPENMDLSRSVVEYLRRFTDSEQAARDLAGAFLFSGIDQDKPLAVLSGGERTRAALAGLIVGGHNLLVLDEPTNHLDIPSAERLEDALARYLRLERAHGKRDEAGTLILITHDRMLLQDLVDQLLVFDGRGDVRLFHGSYREYVEQQRQAAAASSTTAATASAPTPSLRKIESAAASVTSPAVDRPHRKLSNQKLDQRIEQIERRKAEIDAALADPQTYRDASTARDLQQQRRDVVDELATLETEWLLRAERA
jgi:ATP-binding cassette, subfamily F, member 3